MNLFPTEILHHIFSVLTVKVCKETLPVNGNSSSNDEHYLAGDEEPLPEDNNPSLNNEHYWPEDEDCVSESDDSQACDYPLLGRDGIQELRALRLSNRMLAEVASVYLFEEIWLYFTETSYRKLEAISKHPTYSTYVHRLCIIPKALPGPFLDRLQFENWMLGKGNFVSDPRLLHVNGEKYAEFVELAKKKWDCEPFDRQHAEYQNIYSTQAAFLPEARALLQSAVGRLPQLIEVVSGVEWPERRIGSHARSLQDCCLFSNERRRNHMWKGGLGMQVFDMEQAESDLRALVRGQSRSGAQIVITSFLQDCDTRSLDLRDAEGAYLLLPFIANVKRLNVFFNSFNIEGLIDFVKTGKFAGFLGLLTKLESLVCSTQLLQEGRAIDHTFVVFNIADIFPNITWQNLTTLTLERFLATESQLNNLLSRHKPTLRELALRNITLDEGSWYAIFANLRGGVLERIGILHLSYHETAAMLLREDYYEYSDTDYLAKSHPLHRFIVSNEAWYPGIESMLHADDACRGLDDLNSHALG